MENVVLNNAFFFDLKIALNNLHVSTDVIDEQNMIKELPNGIQ